MVGSICANAASSWLQGRIGILQETAVEHITSPADRSAEIHQGRHEPGNTILAHYPDLGPSFCFITQHS